MSIPVVHIAAVTHRGSVRPENQDAILIDDWLSQDAMTAPQIWSLPLDRPRLCLTADGMGGHAGGAQASRLVAEYFRDHISELAPDADTLAQHLHALNAELYRRMADDPALAGMGATVAGLVLEPEQVAVFNVGDSRVYRRQGPWLEQLSIDDSPHKTYGDPDASRASHIVTQALGGMNRLTAILPHIQLHPLTPGREYLICTDGLTDAISLDELEAATGDEVVIVAQTLLNLALARGAADNVSLILIKAT
jgi:protein phosphatase